METQEEYLKQARCPTQMYLDVKDPEYEGKKIILKYADTAMQSAMLAVRERRFKLREAARHFGVPHSTLVNKLKGRVPAFRKMGPDTYFTKTEENRLKSDIIANLKKGIPLKHQKFMDTLKKILDDDQRITPFKDNRPGKKWMHLFLKRHPEITEQKRLLQQGRISQSKTN
ncbi:hypothetical protein evm_005199 [Chilo suppressalis]|nr:hypothetical protein evm_005199 [Chilo suppressalis]